MAKKRFFRADKRPFVKDDPIATAGEFMAKHPDAGKLMEEALEKDRPADKPKREDCLMLFEDEECARNHWAKMKDGRLYRVEVDDADILHRGDMKLAEMIGDTLLKDRTADVGAVAAEYWDGKDGGNCMETLVKGGIVVEEIGSPEERLERFKRLVGFSRAEGPEPFENEVEALFANWDQKPEE